MIFKESRLKNLFVFAAVLIVSELINLIFKQYIGKIVIVKIFFLFSIILFNILISSKKR
jgi:hypothetical protein